MTHVVTAPVRQPLPVILVPVLAAVTFALGYHIDEPFLMAVPGFAILGGLFAWSQPFVICALFIAISYFRLPEAYEWMSAFKPALLLGTASVALVGVKGLLSETRGTADSRSLKVICIVTLFATIGLAVPLSFMRAGGSVGLDALLIPATMICAALCAVSWTVLLSSASEHPLPKNVQLFTAFFVLICLTTIFSRVPGDSFDWWATITWKIAAMTLATAWLVRSERDLLHASNIFIISGLMISAMVFYNKIYSLSLVQETRVAIGFVGLVNGQQASGAKILSDPNDLALIMMFPLAFALARFVHRRGLTEGILAIVACCVMLTAIVFTESRGAFIGVLVIVALLLLQRYRSAILGLMAVALAGSIMFAAMGLATRSGGEMDDGGLDESAQHRIDAWETAVVMAASRPLVGVGISNFPQMYYSYTNHWRSRMIAVHSMWFQVLGELGFLAFGVFVAMIWTSFRLNAETIRMLERAHAPPALRATAAGLQAALAGTCASGTFLSQAYTWPVYIILALIAALYNLTKTYVARAGGEAEDASADLRQKAA